MHIGQIEAIYPASPAEQDLLAGLRCAPGRRDAGASMRFTLRGGLDRDAFDGAWRDAARRHPALRASFAWKLVSRPLRLVHERVVPAPESHDWGGLSAAQRGERLRALLDEGADLDPSVPPLVRPHLCRLSADEHLLVVRYHPLVLGARGVRLLLADVLSLYERRRAGADSPADAARAPAVYAPAPGAAGRAEAEEFWAAALGDFGAPTPLPFAREALSSRPAQPSREAASLRLTPELTARLSDAAARHGLTLETLLPGVWGVLLSRYTGEADVMFGAALADATAAGGFAPVVGPVTGLYPVRVRVGASAPALEWLQELQAHLALARRHGGLPAERVRKLSGVAQDQTPFETAVSFEGRAFEATSEQTGLDVREGWEPSAEHTALHLAAALTPELELRLTFDAGRFGRAAGERMLRHAEALLASLAGDPNRPLGRQSLLTEREREQLLVGWNSTRAPYPGESCLQHLFEAQARRTPDAVAVECGGRRLTYAELNARANRLARALRGWGAGPEVLVGICVERSPEMVVALLGVVKAGGAYVPLDPGYPLERLSLMLDDAGAPILLTQGRLLDKLPSHWGRTVCLDEEWDEIESESAEDFESGARPDNLAYVIYTSGSTGRPKGTLITHRGLVNYVHWAARAYGAGHGGGAPVHSPLTFDLTVTSLLVPLAAGAKVVLLPDASGVDALTDALRGGADFGLVKLTPAHLEVLNHRLAGGEVAGGSRALVIGGDALSAESLTLWRRRAPGTRLVNEYGPTETVVGCCVYEVTGELPEGGPVPIGRPIANTRLFVLDASLEPVPVGVAGELYIGGCGVARGYLNGPALTAQKFVADPFAEEPGARLYRTGDLARRLDDGNVEFLGRADSQVKIRGYRIEPGEVEAALVSHPGVREAAVTAREDVPGSRRLAAFLVASRGETLAPDALRGFLAARLPEYMIPATFVWLDRMPLTAHGKVDLRALHSLDAARPAASAGDFAPTSNPVEATLAGIWAQALGLERVGVDDNFFELGGDSILGIRVIDHANRAGLRLTMDHLFQGPTVREMAAAAGSTPALEEGQGPLAGPAPLLPAQRWFFEQELPNPHHWNIAVLLDAREGADAAHVEAALRRLLAHHDALRLRFVRGAGGWEQSVAEPGGATPFERVDLSGLGEAERRLALEAAAARAQTSLDLGAGPLVRAVFFDLGEGRPARCLLVVHHLAADGVSLRTLLEDLQTCYEQARRGQALELPPKTTSCKRWAELLEEYARSEDCARELEYWLSAPREASAKLPVDNPGGGDTEATTRAVTVALDAEQTAALLQEAPRAYRAQVNEVLLAALAQAFSRWGGSPALLVDLEGHGREQLFDGVDLSRTVGWFTSIFPVLLDVGDALRPQEALREIKEQLRRVPGRGVGYGVLRHMGDGGGAAERLRALGRAEVSFNYLGQFDQVLPAGSAFALADEEAGPNRSPEARRPYLLEVTGRIVGGRLRVDWAYGGEVHRRETVEDLAGLFLEELRALVEHARSPEGAGYAPSDFPGARLSQQELDKFIAKISKGDGRTAGDN